jgi:hypothetical protein
MATIILEPDVMRQVPKGFDLPALKKAIETDDLGAEFEMAKPSTNRHPRCVRFTAAQVVAVVDGDRTAARAALSAQQQMAVAA